MKAKKIYNAPKCKPIEIDTASLLMQISGDETDQPGRVEEDDEVHYNNIESLKATKGLW